MSGGGPSSPVSGLLIAGTTSGCGKTTVTLGIMAALRQAGMVVQPFKCGPDFIDPTLHRLVTDRQSWNLDVRMCGSSYVRGLFRRKATAEGVNVIEGVMVLFDGGSASAAALSRLLSVPVVLVVDASSAAESIAAVVKGFETFMPGLRPSGIILNRIASKRHLDLAAGSIERNCTAPVLGSLPRDAKIEIPSRHLGLHMGHELGFRQDIERIGHLIRENVDLDLLLRIAQEADPPQVSGHKEPAASRSHAGQRTRIGVARDEAFCFYYQDNLEMLKEAGAEIVEFSPLRDQGLPDGIHGLYLGGGYPELHAEQLSENRQMRREIRAFALSGQPVLAECGGFMYLCGSITTTKAETFPMAGVFSARCSMKGRLAALGYRDIEVVRRCHLGPEGHRMRGHEFHYSETRFDNEPEMAFLIRQDGGCRKEGYRIASTVAGYVHIHFGSNPESAVNFVTACRATSPMNRSQ
jgi:cobyrinic acid a,c-diamide synthase